MPAPVSLTTISTCELTRSRRTWTRPSLGVNLTALVNRFQMTCCRRSGSPETGPTAGSMIVWTTTPLALAAGWTVATASWTIDARFTGCTSRRILPETILDTSSTSSTIWVSQVALRSSISRPRSDFSPDRTPPRRSRAYPTIAFNGVRSSCDSTARNSSFIRLASCASAYKRAFSAAQARLLGDVAGDLRGADDGAAARCESATPSAKSTGGCRPCAGARSRNG